MPMKEVIHFLWNYVMASNAPLDNKVSDFSQEKSRGIIRSIQWPELFGGKTMMFMFSFSIIESTWLYFSMSKVDCKSFTF